LILRPYQVALEDQILTAWEQHPYVAAVLPTGGGKTIIFSDIIRKHQGYSMAIAHRQELVSQISTSLATSSIDHNIIAPDKIIRWICGLHTAKFGRHFYNPNAKPQVAGVDTLIKRAHKFPQLCEAVTLWVLDECHHLLRKNKWGKAVELFPNAKGLGVTATPLRADGHGLGSHASGVFESLCVGPNMRDLIEEGFLSDYKVYSIPSNIDLSQVKVTATGDFNRTTLKTASRASHIVGDIVEHYLRLAPGKLGVTFVTDVETAADVAMQYRHAGVPAEAVHAKTPNKERQAAIERFSRRELMQLVNVDLFGEGFDLPAIEVISMARPTESYGLYCQQFGRVLRPLPGKDIAIIIDHVGNVMRHKLPDYGRAWSLDSRERRSNGADASLKPVKTCYSCSAVYEGYSDTCPYCGHVHKPTDRSRPEFVEGDLTLLDPDTIAELRGEISRVDSPASAVSERLQHAGAPLVAAKGAAAQHHKRQLAQQMLRDVIAIWAGYRRAEGLPDAESYRMFWHKFGVDVMTAQTLGRPDAEKLTANIVKEIM